MDWLAPSGSSTAAPAFGSSLVPGQSADCVEAAAGGLTADCGEAAAGGLADMVEGKLLLAGPAGGLAAVLKRHF